MDYTIGAMNLSATHVEKMVEFYAAVFGIEFEEHELDGGTLHAGVFAGTEFTILPAALTQVTAEQNRMQLDIVVPDLDRVIELAEAHGGRTNGRLAEDDEVRCIGIYDPDDNFIVFKQPKSRPQ